MANSGETFKRNFQSAGGALDLTANNSWTGVQQFSGASSTRIQFNQSGAAADENLWDIGIASKVFAIRTRTTADAAGQNVLTATRGTGTALTNITFGYAAALTYTFAFTGTATFSGPVTLGTGTLTARIVVANTNPPASGFYAPGTNRVGVGNNSVASAEWDANGNYILKKGSADQSYSLQVPTTGFSIAFPNNIGTLILKPAGTLATGTITLPTTPIDGQVVRFTTSQIITALTTSPAAGQSLVGAVTTLGIGQGAAYLYSLSDTTWYRLYLGS